MMVTTHNLGFPRIGSRRELKFGLESFWKGQSTHEALLQLGSELRQAHWQQQSGLDLVPVGDFSFYDHVLDMSLPWAMCLSELTAYRGRNWITTFGSLAGVLPRTLTASVSMPGK